MISIVDKIRHRIQQHGGADHLEHLCLDQIPMYEFTSEIKHQIQKCVKIGYLTLNYCQITSLNNFPRLPTLICLQIQSNQIKGEQIHHLLSCQYLSHLSLDYNNIYKIEDLECLKSLQILEHLEVKGNPLCEHQNYRQEIFTLIEQLNLLDCRDRQGNVDALYETQDGSQDAESDNFQYGDLSSSQDQLEDSQDLQKSTEGDNIRKNRKM